MQNKRQTQEHLDAKSILSTRELEAAMLARINVGRNGIAAVLGISVNSVKTLMRRIKQKLGQKWLQDKNIIWPQTEEAQESDGVETLNELDQFENGYYHRLERELTRQFKARRGSFLLLISQSHPGKDIIHVTSSQRFWLRPVLKELEDRKYIKLLRVDWNETFSPNWLPLINRGRKEIRAADYVTYNAQFVVQYINDYIKNDLEDYLLECTDKLKEVKTTSKHNTIPNIKDLTSTITTN